LMSSGNFLVTYIPNCENWDTAKYLVDIICASFGADFDELKHLFFNQENNVGGDFLEDVFPDFIIAINEVLMLKGKKWVFIFDEIDCLFAKNPTADDIEDLPFPYNMMKHLMYGVQIIPIITTSKMDEDIEKERYQGFEVYNHKPSMTQDEVQKAFNVSNDILEEIQQWSGNVPLYVHEFLNIYDTVKVI
jgi:hypothetical protein